MVVVLNDNEWSIDKNVGAIASYLNKITTNPKYDHLHEQAARFVEKIGGKRALHHGAEGRRSRQKHALAERNF
jgi:1-deoxy-D-xylulose-5-phosphate synthase